MNKRTYLVLVIIVAALGAWWALKNPNAETGQAKLAWPLERSEGREKKLTFGLFVTPDPAQNPIDPPERFTGFHTALDLETFPEEQSREVPVLAACAGRILAAETAEGYGGVLVHSCQIDGQDVTVLYGHLNPQSFKFNVGNDVKTGETLGILGEGKTAESGFTRKHLHFGVHKGPEVALLGYVQNESQLGQYLDPLPLLSPSPHP